MATNRVDAQRIITAPYDKVFRCIADYAQRPHWLPPAYENYTVETGGQGAGTVIRYTLNVGHRERHYRMAVSEPVAGSSLTEKDTGSSLITTWTVTPSGDRALLAVHTEWQGASGVGGFFERLFAPGALKKVYDDMLERFDRFVAQKA